MKPLDDLFTQLKKAKYSDEIMALVMVIPCYNMAMKLMLRKANGKKPFSAEFDFESKKQAMESAYQDVEEAIMKRQGCTQKSRDALLLISQTITDASQEIKNESLKKDYVYLASVFQDAYTLLGDTNS